MTRHQWSTPAQKSWLENQVPGFLNARAAKGTTEFVNAKIQEFDASWPAIPDKDEMLKAGNDLERARHLATANRTQKIRHWFNNHTRDVKSKRGGRSLLKLNGPPKLVQPWQAYQNLFWETELKTKVDNEWATYQATFPSGTTPDKSYFTFKNKKLHEWYESTSDEVKEQVEKHRLVMKASPGEGGTAKAYQQAINKLPRSLESAAQLIAKQTGWNVTIIAGGPCPRLDGQLTTLVVHEGLSKNKENFEAYLGEKYKDQLIDPFTDFLLSCFVSKDKETQLARSLTSSDDISSDDEQDEVATTDEKGECSKASTSELNAMSSSKLCEYEMTRQANIERNNALLEELGLGLKRTEKDPNQPGKASKRKPRGKKKVEATEIRRSSRGKPDGTSELIADTTHKNIEPRISINGTSGAKEAANGTRPECASLVTSCHNSMTQPESVSPGNSLAVSPTKPGEGAEATPGADRRTTEAMRGQIAPPTQNTTAHISKEQVGRDTDTDVLSTTSSSKAPSDNQSGLSREAESTLDTTLFSSATKAASLSDNQVGLGREVDTPLDTTLSASASKASLSDDQLEHDCALTLSTLPSKARGASSWYQGWLSLFRAASNDDRWVDLVMKWSQFKALDCNEGKLPTKLRPEAIGWWRRQHQALMNLPIIEDVEEYRAHWKSWWVSMQPEWRAGTRLLRDVPSGFKWLELKKGGESGFALIIMALAWWVKATNDNGELFVTTGLADAIEDVNWVLGQLSATTLTLKRPGSPIADKPRSKRLRSGV